VKLLLLALLVQQGPLDSDLAALLPRVPPPRPGGPSVFNVVSSDRIFVGDQLNVVTAAWLPRSLRLRLRQAPTLTPPSLTGVWSTPRTPVPGAVMSYDLGEDTYDLFIGPQTVYPLNPGSLTIPPARLSWIRPGVGFAGEEQRIVAQSSQRVIIVRALPTANQPPGFTGPVAQSLRIEYRLTGGAGRAGTVLPVDVVLTGAGSIPLWPAPSITWPVGVRAYDQGTEAELAASGSRLAGTRRFRFAVVPDSAGGLSLSPLEYPYFDPVSSTYRVARAAGIVVPILEPAPVTDQRFPVPILTPGAAPLVDRLTALPGYALWLIGLAPIGLVFALSFFKRRRRQPVAHERPSPMDRLRDVIQTVLPAGSGSDRQSLVRALRNAGVSQEPAERLVQHHLTVEAVRYGPKGTVLPTAVEREIETELDRLPARVMRKAVVLAIGFLAFLPPAALGQSGEELYGIPDYRGAAQAFRSEAELYRSGARWYNVAAAEYMSRRDAQAVAALLAARALAPREDRARALWDALAREHQALRRAPRTLPITPAEAIALALITSWLTFIGCLVAGKRRRLICGAGVTIAVTFVILHSGLETGREVRRGVLMGGANLRVSPHGLAPARGRAQAFSVVRLIRREANWWLIETEGSRGWVPAEILAESPALN